MSRLRDDARPVELSCSAADQARDRFTHRRGRHEESDQEQLVAEYGDAILAAPQHKGFGLLAWWLPIVGIIAAAVIVGAGAWRWSRRREPLLAGPPLDPALEARLNDELRRFDD